MRGEEVDDGECGDGDDEAEVLPTPIHAKEMRRDGDEAERG